MRNSHHVLTDKQLRWIDEYLIDFNGAAAAIRAGYSPKSARSIAQDNLRKHYIQAVLREKQAEMAKELQITRLGVIRGLLDVVEIGRKLNNPASMVAALSTISKMLWNCAPEVKRVVLTTEQRGARTKVAAMTDAQLLALLEQGAAVSS